jgi:ATP-binding cassette subfamily F protein 3
MSILTATNLYKAYDPQEIFWDVDLSIAHGEKIALVGPNGAGKTTLLRILIGLEEPTEGRVARMGKINIGYLPQDSDQVEDQGALLERTPWQLCTAIYADLIEMQARLRALEARLGDGDEAVLEQYGRLLERFEHAGGYEYEVEIRTVLSGLGIDELHAHRRLDQLSGGQRTRALLGMLLLERPNILVLDEPTNHLDLDAIEWLETYLKTWPEAVLVVSHDRYFMDRVAEKMWDMEFGQVEVYSGNYSAYVLQREERIARRLKEWKAQQAYIAKTEEFIRRFKAGQRSKEARGRETRLARMKRLERPQRAHTISLRLEGEHRSGELVIETTDLVVGYDRPLVRVPDLQLRRLQRAALIGPNGSGKTTLVRTILGQLAPLAGEARLGASLRIGYLAQTRESLNPDSRVIDEIERAQHQQWVETVRAQERRAQGLQAQGMRAKETRAREMREGEMRDFMARYLFTGDDVYKQISDLSGGEQVRVALAKLTLSGPNFLVLDEPTNQLDIASQEIMEAVLREYVGTVLFVSHDRYLIDALATQVWVIEGDEMRVYAGDYQQYLVRRAREQEAARERAAKEQERARQEAARAEERRRRLHRGAEARGPTLEEVEDQIHELEARLQQLGAELSEASAAQEFDRVRDLGVEYQRFEAELEELMVEWTALGEASA